MDPEMKRLLKKHMIDLHKKTTVKVIRNGIRLIDTSRFKQRSNND